MNACSQCERNCRGTRLEARDRAPGSPTLLQGGDCQCSPRRVVWVERVREAPATGLAEAGGGVGGGDTSRTPGSLGWEPSRTASTLTTLRTEGHTLPRDRALSVRLEIGDQGSLSDGIRGVCCLVLVIFGL